LCRKKFLVVFGKESVYLKSWRKMRGGLLTKGGTYSLGSHGRKGLNQAKSAASGKVKRGREDGFFAS